MSNIDMWWLSIGIFAAVVVVVAVLLGLIVATAKSIDQHAVDIWIAGKQIAGNTVTIWVLKKITEETEAVRDYVAAISSALDSMKGKSR